MDRAPGKKTRVEGLGLAQQLGQLQRNGLYFGVAVAAQLVQPSDDLRGRVGIDSIAVERVGDPVELSELCAHLLAVLRPQVSSRELLAREVAKDRRSPTRDFEKRGTLCGPHQGR